MNPVRTSVEVEEYHTEVGVANYHTTAEVAYRTWAEVKVVGIKTLFHFIHPAQVVSEDKGVPL